MSNIILLTDFDHFIGNGNDCPRQTVLFLSAVIVALTYLVPGHGESSFPELLFDPAFIYLKHLICFFYCNWTYICNNTGKTCRHMWNNALLMFFWSPLLLSWDI